MSEVVMTPAMQAFAWSPDLRHAPGSPDEERGGFRSPCRCGYSGKWVKSSPSHAYQATRVHAENENRRELAGGRAVDPTDYSASGEPPRARGVQKRSVENVDLPNQIQMAPDAPGGPQWAGSSRASVGSRRASRTGVGTPCGCGCGDLSGGLFRPGHDSKLLSLLMGAIRAGTMTLAEAHARMDEIGTSDKLKAKLAQKVGA